VTAGTCEIGEVDVQEVSGKNRLAGTMKRAGAAATSQADARMGAKISRVISPTSMLGWKPFRWNSV
jgi:hypothetical protein